MSLYENLRKSVSGQKTPTISDEDVLAELDKVYPATTEIVDQQLARGVPVYYADDEYPSKVIKELPSGERFLVGMDEETGEEIILSAID